jgi:putative component of membrane protein insertase Oxa1/YidC/SpoIIIJ protein YidD
MRFSLLLLYIPLLADPWGKDADLLIPKTKIATHPSTLSDTLIRFHQNVISPADGPRSHFIPSSSQYTRGAMHKYGFFQGFLLGCDRLQRENKDPWVYRTILSGKYEMKYDPVR